MEENQKKGLREMICNFDESMKHAMDTLKDIFRVVDPLINPEKFEETPKKVVKKRQPKRVKRKSELSGDWRSGENDAPITLNVDAPIAAHHSRDKGTGQIEYTTLE